MTSRVGTGFLAWATLFAGCSDPAGLDIRMEVVTPQGTDPTAGVDRIDVRVREDDLAPEFASAAVQGGQFDLPVPVGSGSIAAQVELSGPGGLRLLGAPPRFFAPEAVDSGGGFSVRIPVGVPRTCAKVRWRADPDPSDPETGMGFPTGLADGGLTLQGSFALVVGGIGADGVSSTVAFLDLLQLSRGTYPAPVGLAPGRVQAVAVSDRLALGLGESPFLFDVREGTTIPLTAPLEVTRDSGLAARDGGGAVIAGGGSAASRALLIVDENGVTVEGVLLADRRAPAVATRGDSFVVGGGTAGDAKVEWGRFSLPDDQRSVDAAFDGERHGAWIFVSQDASQVLLGGGTDALGALRTDTLWLSGCPIACEAREGPRWETAREGAVWLASRRGGGWIVGGAGSGAVERVSFTESDPVVDAFAALETARSEVTLLELDAGILYVGGGRTPGGFSAEVEICFPDDLAF